MARTGPAAESDGIALPPRAEAELAEAAQAQRAAVRAPGEASASSAAPGKRSLLNPAESERAGPSAARTQFQDKIGIQAVAVVKRNGTRCMMCDGALQKNEWKFQFAYKLSKPPRSIHVSCMGTIDRESAVNSQKFLQVHLSQGGASAEERQVCTEALEILGERLETARACRTHDCTVQVSCSLLPGSAFELGRIE